MAKRPERKTNIDPAIASMLEDDPRAARMQPKEPPKRDRSWDAKRTKATYDLPAAVIERIRGIAEELGDGGITVKVSDVARLLIEAGLAQYDAGELHPKPKAAKLVLFDD